MPSHLLLGADKPSAEGALLGEGVGQGVTSESSIAPVAGVPQPALVACVGGCVCIPLRNGHLFVPGQHVGFLQKIRKLVLFLSLFFPFW